MKFRKALSPVKSPTSAGLVFHLVVLLSIQASLPPLDAREPFKSEVGVVVAMARARHEESRIERGGVDGIKGVHSC